MVRKVRSWMMGDGVRRLRRIRDEHGQGAKVAVVIDDWEHFPHPVHLREGVVVRNFLRGLPETGGWTDADYDDRWESIVLEAIR